MRRALRLDGKNPSETDHLGGAARGPRAPMDEAELNSCLKDATCAGEQPGQVKPSMPLKATCHLCPGKASPQSGNHSQKGEARVFGSTHPSEQRAAGLTSILTLPPCPRAEVPGVPGAAPGKTTLPRPPDSRTGGREAWDSSPPGLPCQTHPPGGRLHPALSTQPGSRSESPPSCPHLLPRIQNHRETLFSLLK